jgi:hypothetical protein
MALVIQLIVLPHAFPSQLHSLELEEALQRVAGIYTDPLRQAGYEKTVIIASVNSGYVDFFFNLHCFLQQLDMKILAIALDTEAHALLKDYAYSFHYTGSLTPETTGQVAKYGEKQFIDICIRRIEAIVEILQLGYSVLFLDVDVAVLRDPIPLLQWTHIDWVLSVDKGYAPG